MSDMCKGFFVKNWFCFRLLSEFVGFLHGICFDLLGISWFFSCVLVFFRARPDFQAGGAFFWCKNWSCADFGCGQPFPGDRAVAGQSVSRLVEQFKFFFREAAPPVPEAAGGCGCFKVQASGIMML